VNRALIAAVSLVLLASLSAQADELAPARRWGLDASTGASYITDRNFDLVGGADALPVGDFRASFTPGWLANHLELNAAYVITGEGGSSASSWQSSFGMQSIQLGASYRWRPSTWIGFYARAAAVLDVDKLTLSATTDSLPLSQTAVTAGALGGLGTEFTFVHERHFDAGLTLEVGYALRFNSARFDQLKPDTGGAAPAPVAFAPVNAGAFDVSGIQWRVGVAVHF
jgi:hypothetical protein